MGEGYENFGQFKVFDLNNNPVSNFSYVTESGSPYNITGGTNASAPEPATFFTAGAMLGLIVTCARPSRSKKMGRSGWLGTLWGSDIPPRFGSVLMVEDSVLNLRS